jgi:hypothetical protein
MQRDHALLGNFAGDPLHDKPPRKHSLPKKPRISQKLSSCENISLILSTI